MSSPVSIRSFRFSLLAAAVGCSLSVSTAFAVVLDNQTLTVTASDPLDTYQLINDSLLIVDGATTRAIVARESRVNMIDGTTSVVNGSAVGLSLSQAVIAGSTISSTNGFGLVLARPVASLQGSTADVRNSVITGGPAGIQVNAGGVLQLLESQVSATSTNGNGIRLLGGTAQITDSSVVGQNAGVSMRRESLQRPDIPALTVSGGTIQGNAGAGIDVNSSGAATVQLSNGAQVSSANGDAVTVAANSQLTLAAHESVIGGNVLVADGGSADLRLERSTLVGDVRNEGAGPVSLALADESAMTGNVLNAESVTLATGSVITGNVLDSQSVALSGSSAIVGDVLNAESVELAGGSAITGDVLNAQTVALAGSSAITGNVLDAQSLALAEDSAMNGDVQNVRSVTVAGRSTLSGSVQSGQSLVLSGESVLSGNVLNVELVELEGGSRILGDVAGVASMTVANSSHVTGNVRDTELLTLTGGSLFEGNLTSVQSFNLDSGSHFTGVTSAVQSASIGVDSSWNLTGNSTVGDLALNGGQVIFGDTPSFYDLTVTNLSGNGNFHMGNDFVTGAGDQLIVTGTSSGNFGLLVASTGQEASVDTLRLVQTADGAAQFHLLNERDRVDVGAYSYELMQDGNDWVLNRETRIISPVARSVMALFNTPITVAYGEMSSLRSRMGELRYSEGRSAGLWMRAYGNQYNVADASSGVGYQQNQRGLSLGADMQIADSDWLVGVLAGSSRSDLNLSYGTSGSVDSYYLGGYATWLDRETGYYVDTVVKYNRYQNNATVGLSDFTRAKGDYDTHGLSASVEVGKHIKLNDGYFIEPFAQVATVAVAGKDYSFSNGLRAEGDTAKSLMGKVGTTVGKTIELDGGSMIQPYVKAAFGHEFAQRNEVQVNNNVFNNDLSGSRAELGAGVSLALSKQFRIHADVEYSNGKNIEQPYGVNLGVRYDF